MLPDCPHCQLKNRNPEEKSKAVVCFGHFTRKCDQKRLQRFRCESCQRTFSEASFSRCCYQKKRHLNGSVFELLVSGLSQRRLARYLRINRKTVVRKFLFLGACSQELLLKTNKEQAKATSIQFDDLESFEHTKCKPLSVTMAVEEGSRRILGFRVARMPAKGLLAALSRKKYGPRKDERPEAQDALFDELKELVEERALLQSDKNPHYVSPVRKHFPKAE
ncbi:MAG: transposase, partial [Pseudobdellovibrionaceae bacterium]